MCWCLVSLRGCARLGTEAALTVPTTALITAQNERALYRIGEDNRATVVAVKTGREIRGRTVVMGALSAGDRIVTGNLQAVRPDASVKPAESSTSAQGTKAATASDKTTAAASNGGNGAAAEDTASGDSPE